MVLAVSRRMREPWRRPLSWATCHSGEKQYLEKEKQLLLEDYRITLRELVESWTPHTSHTASFWKKVWRRENSWQRLCRRPRNLCKWISVSGESQIIQRGIIGFVSVRHYGWRNAGIQVRCGDKSYTTSPNGSTVTKRCYQQVLKEL